MPMKKKDLFASFKIEKEDVKKGGRFLAVFLVVYIILVSVFFLVPAIEIEKAVASGTLGLLQLFGISGTISVQETAIIALQGGQNIRISELCTGLQELMIIVSAMLASIGISWRRRIIGAAAGAVISVLFNFLRITATILIIVSTTDLGIIEFTHNILFRIFLFATIAVTYIAWFQWAIKEKKQEK